MKGSLSGEKVRTPVTEDNYLMATVNCESHVGEYSWWVLMFQLHGRCIHQYCFSKPEKETNTIIINTVSQTLSP
jgi:hypothetical protein